MQRPTSTAVALLCTDAGAGGTQLPIALKGQWIFWRYTFVMLIDRPFTPGIEGTIFIAAQPRFQTTFDPPGDA